MRFKDLLGRSGKPEPEPAPGRLITPPSGPDAHVVESESRVADRSRPPEPRAPTLAPPPGKAAAPPPGLPVADRFALLLAVEQGETTLPPGPGDEPGVTLSEEDLDRLARRVAERLTSSPLAADVQRIVAEVSERLVKEEIARIRKAAESRTP